MTGRIISRWKNIPQRCREVLMPDTKGVKHWSKVTAMAQVVFPNGVTRHLGLVGTTWVDRYGTAYQVKA